jgi:hypothetical protein
MAKAGARSQRRVVPLGAALALVLFSYPSCAVGALFLTAGSDKDAQPILGIPTLLLGVGLLLAGLAALPRAPRLLRLASVVLASAAFAALGAGVFLIRQGGGRSGGGGALCAFAALVFAVALVLLRAARGARKKAGARS